MFSDHDRSSPWETKTLTRKVKNIYRHRGYGNGGSFNNDIALLQMDQDVSTTDTVRPICLPPTGRSFTGYEGNEDRLNECLCVILKLMYIFKHEQVF